VGPVVVLVVEAVPAAAADPVAEEDSNLYILIYQFNDDLISTPYSLLSHKEAKKSFCQFVEVSFFLKKRTKNISSARLQFVEIFVLFKKRTKNISSATPQFVEMFVLFKKRTKNISSARLQLVEMFVLLKKEPKTLALRGLRSLTVCFF
jgi:hypothetical protein